MFNTISPVIQATTNTAVVTLKWERVLSGMLN